MLNYGLDVHKRYTTFCVMDDAGNILKEARCANAELPLHPAFSLKGKKRATIEAGGNWYAVYDSLEPLVDELILAHPLRVRAIAAARVKTDEIDARTLAHLLRSDLIPAAYVPPRDIRDLREFLRFRHDLVRKRTSTKNQVHALLAKEGHISPASDLFGVKGRRWMDELPLPEQQRYQLRGYQRVLDCLTEEIHEADRIIKRKCAGNWVAKLLDDLPGIGPLSALVIFAELGEITRFRTPEKLASFAGLAPRVRSSGGKTRRGPVTKQGPSALRWVLIEAVHHAVRKPGRVQALHRRLERRGKHPSVVKTACARELLLDVYFTWKRGEAFRGDGGSTSVCA
ncbi:MAG: IS110 family transposase [Chloroflexi bacterium]|nr:IS110 family transposase [Chloroflexota bacterium]